jgi:hypothetical protein
MRLNTGKIFLLPTCHWPKLVSDQSITNQTSKYTPVLYAWRLGERIENPYSVNGSVIAISLFLSSWDFHFFHHLFNLVNALISPFEIAGVFLFSLMNFDTIPSSRKEERVIISCPSKASTTL